MWRAHNSNGGRGFAIPPALPAMVLTDYINRHAGETAWLFGKGPSLATFDFNTAGPLRAAINDVIAHVPNCVYGFANDGVKRWRDCYQKGQTLFQPVRCLHEFDSTQPGAVACDVVIYQDGYGDTRLLSPRETLAQELAIRRGTLGSALQILHVMGVSAVHMVGIDGGGKRADGYQWRTPLRINHGIQYEAIRSEAIDSADLMGITLRFHNQDHTAETDGKVYVKFLRNCFADSTPYYSRQIVRMNPRTAKELFHAQAAEPFAPNRPAPG